MKRTENTFTEEAWLLTLAVMLLRYSEAGMVPAAMDMAMKIYREIRRASNSNVVCTDQISALLTVPKGFEQISCIAHIKLKLMTLDTGDPTGTNRQSSWTVICLLMTTSRTSVHEHVQPIPRGRHKSSLQPQYRYAPAIYCIQTLDSRP
jgi:hypothetical protein